MAYQSYLQQLQSIGEFAKTKNQQIVRCNDDRQRIVGGSEEEETIPRLAQRKELRQEHIEHRKEIDTIPAELITLSSRFVPAALFCNLSK